MVLASSFNYFTYEEVLKCFDGDGDYPKISLKLHLPFENLCKNVDRVQPMLTLCIFFSFEMLPVESLKEKTLKGRMG